MANKRTILILGILLISISTSDNKVAIGSKPAAGVVELAPHQNGGGSPTSIFPLKNLYEIRAGEDAIIAEFYAECPSTATEPAKFFLGPEAPDFVYIVVSPCTCQEAAKAVLYALPRPEQTGKYIFRVFAQACSGLGGADTIKLKVKPPRGN